METFESFSTRWAETILPLKKPATQCTMGSHIRLLNARLGPCPLPDITYAAVQQVFSDLSKEQLPRSVKNVHGTYVNLMGQAVREKLIEKYPKPVLPKIKKAAQEWLTLEQMRLIIKNADDKHRPFLALLAEAGPRVGEAFGLQVGDLTGQTLHIQRSIFNGNSQDPKTDNAIRKIYVSAQLRDLLKSCADSGYLFKTRSGGAWWQCYVRKYTDSLLRSLSIEPVGFHAWRRGNATALASQFAVPTKIIGDRLGHSHKDLTLGCYAQTIEGSDKPYIDAYAKELYG